MFYNKEIDILTIGEGYLDEDGIYHEGTETLLKSISCDVQPYSKDRLYRDYGFNEEVKFRVFSDIDPAIKNGVKINYKGEKFKIVRVIEWDNFFEWVINDE